MEQTVLIENAIWELERGRGDLEAAQIRKRIIFVVSSSSERFNTRATRRTISSLKWQIKEHQDRRSLWEEPFSGGTVGKVGLWYKLPQ